MVCGEILFAVHHVISSRPSGLPLLIMSCTEPREQDLISFRSHPGRTKHGLTRLQLLVFFISCLL